MDEHFIDQPVAVQVRLAPDGQILPLAFAWQGQTYAIVGLGRQWQENVAGATWRCFLAETTGGVVELRWQDQRQVWRLWRAWWRPLTA